MRSHACLAPSNAVAFARDVRVSDAVTTSPACTGIVIALISVHNVSPLEVDMPCNSPFVQTLAEPPASAAGGAA